MSEYERLKVKYDTLIKDSLDCNKRKLVDSFVDYYGEEYRSIIKKKYNEITFVYYVDWQTIDLVVEEFIPQVENPDEYEDFINLSNSRKIKEPIFEKIFNLKRKKDLPDNLIGTTNPLIFKKNYIKERLSKSLKNPSAGAFNYGNSNHMDRIIYFQILSLNEVSIIHEINHAITSDIIAGVMEENQSVAPVNKTGLSIDISHQNNGERMMEELLNEKASREITKIFKQKGGDLSAFCFDIPLIYPYEDNLYLVDEFYDEFKKYIKVARISDNKNQLVEHVGKTNYENYVALVNSSYTTEEELISKNKLKNQQKVKNIVDKMRSVESNSNDISQEEVNDYYESLKKQGYNVRVLNNIMDESRASTQNDNSIKRK